MPETTFTSEESSFLYPKNAREIPKRRTPLPVPSGHHLTDAGTVEPNKPQTY